MHYQYSSSLWQRYGILKFFLTLNHIQTTTPVAEEQKLTSAAATQSTQPIVGGQPECLTPLRAVDRHLLLLRMSLRIPYRELRSCACANGIDRHRWMILSRNGPTLSTNPSPDNTERPCRLQRRPLELNRLCLHMRVFSLNFRTQ